MSDKIELDDYQAVNLLSALRASGVQNSYPNVDPLPRPNALAVLNSGDWIGELINILEARLELLPGQSLSEFQSKRYGLMHPNFTPREYVERSYRQFQLDLQEIERLDKEFKESCPLKKK